MAVLEQVFLAVCFCVSASPVFTPYLSVPYSHLHSYYNGTDSLLSVVTSWSMLVSLARLALLGAIAYRLYALIFTPLHVVKHMEETGYVQHADKHMRQEMWAGQVVRRRKRGDVPPVYPNGWFGVLNSSQLKRGTAQSVTILGKQLAVFRGEDNRAYVLDAYCPHLGANLGCGGQVRGNCLECPFHGWTFRGDDGKCVRVPYSEKVPDFAKTNAHTVVEMNGNIYMWFHAEGIEPDWMPEEVPEITGGRWRCVGMTEHTINAHIEV